MRRFMLFSMALLTIVALTIPALSCTETVSTTPSPTSTPIPTMTPTTIPTSTPKPVASYEFLNSTELNEKYFMHQYLSPQAVKFLEFKYENGSSLRREGGSWCDYYGVVGDCTGDGKPDLFLVLVRATDRNYWSGRYHIIESELDAAYELYIGTNAGFELMRHWQDQYIAGVSDGSISSIGASNFCGYLHYFENSVKGTAMIKWTARSGSKLNDLYTICNFSTNSLDLFEISNPSQDIVADLDANGQDELIIQHQKLATTKHKHWSSPTKFSEQEISGLLFVLGFGKDGLFRQPGLEYQLLSVARDIAGIANDLSLGSSQKYSGYMDIWDRSPRMAGAATMILGSTQFQDYMGLQLTYMFSGLVRDQLQSAFVNALTGDYAGAAINVGLAFLTERMAANTIRQLQAPGGTTGQGGTGSGSSQEYGSYEVGSMTVDGNLLTDFERNFNVVTEDRVDEIQRQQQERNQHQ